MRTIIYMACWGWLICCGSACRKTSTPAQNLSQLEAAYQKQPNETTGDTLIKALLWQSNQAADQHAVAGGHLLRAAAVATDLKRFGPATNYLQTAIKEHFAAPTTPVAITRLATLYATAFKNTTGATALYKGLLVSFPTDSLAANARQQLGKDTTATEADLATMGKLMYDEKKGQLDQLKALLFINQAQIYAMTQPQSPKAPEYLLKSAETARYLKAYNEVISTYDWVLAKYPDYAGASKALFLKAFTYDNDLKDTAKARPIYQTFLQKYPKDDFADDAQLLLSNMGKSEEEIIEAMLKAKGGK